MVVLYVYQHIYHNTYHIYITYICITLSKLISLLEKRDFNLHATLIFKLLSPSGLPKSEKIETSAYNNSQCLLSVYYF